jgi:hypothetical protein
VLFAASLSVSNIYLYTYIINKLLDFFCVGAMYSGEYDACDVTLSVYPHRASLKNMPGHGGNRTYDLWNTSPNVMHFPASNTNYNYNTKFANFVGL